MTDSPRATKVQALWTLYFSERYGLPVEAVLLRQTALMAPMVVVASLLEGVVETALIQRGWAAIDIRRGLAVGRRVIQTPLRIFHK